MSVLAYRAPFSIGWDPLRDTRYEQARAAREVADWLAALTNRGLAPRTVRQYAYTAWDLLELFPDKTVGEFTPGDIDQLLARYPRAGLAPRWAHIRSLFAHLRRRRLIPENPIEFMEPLRRKRAALPDIFSDAYVNALYALPAPDGQLMKVRFELGLRSGECRRLKWAHINLDAELASIFKSKNDAGRMVPLTPTALQALEELRTVEGLGPDDHLWYTKPGGGSRLQHRFLTDQGPGEETFRSWWKRCCEAAGVPYKRPHVSRHTRATTMRREGYDLDEIQLWLGHKSIETTRSIYVHTDIFDVLLRMREIEAEKAKA